ncbi:hypothetical protein WBS46_16760 [Bacillus albus]|nr:hypothetical protein [Bacillus albus]
MKYTLQVGEITEIYEGTPEEIALLLETQEKYKADCDPKIKFSGLPHLQE